MSVWDTLKKALKNEEACRRYAEGVREEKKPETPMEVALIKLREASEKKGTPIRVRLI